MNGGWDWWSKLGISTIVIQEKVHETLLNPLFRHHYASLQIICKPYLYMNKNPQSWGFTHNLTFSFTHPDPRRKMGLWVQAFSHFSFFSCNTVHGDRLFDWQGEDPGIQAIPTISQTTAQKKWYQTHIEIETHYVACSESCTIISGLCRCISTFHLVG